MVKSHIDEEVAARIEYFEKQLESPNSNISEQAKVVDEATAVAFIRDIFRKDKSLSNLIEGMDANGQGYDKLIAGKFIQGLIKDNGGDGTAAEIKSFNREMQVRVLEGKTPLRYAKLPNKLRKTVIRQTVDVQLATRQRFMVTTTSKGYVQYRGKDGKFLSNDKMLVVVDNVMKKNVEKRKEILALIEKTKVKD